MRLKAIDISDFFTEKIKYLTVRISKNIGKRKKAF
jgi:hypothetical protein